MAKNGNSLVRVNGKNYLIPFILVTSLFFLWGFAHGLLDVLNKTFQIILHLSKADSAFVQMALYGGYLLMAVPAGLFINRYGYKRGIIFGLLLYATGAFMMFGATNIAEFWAFLVCLFIIACGLTILETAANPYSTKLGPKESAAQRINISQSFNGMGWIFGPLIGGIIIFGTFGGDVGDAAKEDLTAIAIPYAMIAILVLLVAVMFFFTKLPEIKEEDEDAAHGLDNSQGKVVKRHFFKYPHFYLGVIAQFLYVAAQTGINSFFINYVSDEVEEALNAMYNLLANVLGDWILQMNVEQRASVLLAIFGMGLFWLGRVSGSYFLKFVKPNKLLAIYGLMNVLTMALVVAGLNMVSVISICISYYFMSIMFPTIFALGIKNLGEQSKKASSYLVMAVAGGAVIPWLMGKIADLSDMKIAFIIPLVCFAFIAYYGFSGYRVKFKYQQ